MEVIKPSLTSYQKDIIFSKARFTVTEASTKVGKTYSHILWLFGKSHEFEEAEGFNYWWVAPVFTQSKIAFNRLRRNLRKYSGYSFNESNLIIKCPNKAEIHFKSADNPDNLYGEDVYAAVFDEAPRAKVEAWYALRSTLTATEAPCKLIGNFKGIGNWVHKLKDKAKTDTNYQYFKITCWDAVREKVLSIEEVQQAKRDLPNKIFKELYEAEPTDDEGQLINGESISKIFTNKVQEGVKYITADIARLGKDYTIIYLWSGLSVIEIIKSEKSLVTEVASYIKTLQIKHNVNNNNTVCDEDGVGGGVVDILKCKGFVNNSKPIKIEGKMDNFANLKSQCYFKLADYINENKISVVADDKIEEKLTEELEWVRLSKEIDTTKIALMSKDEVKKQIGRSPDYSDALMMRMIFELNPHFGKYSVM